MSVVLGREELPRFLEPMLCRAGDLPEGAGWCLQVKFDGVRGQLRASRRGWSVRSRPGHDRTDRFPELAGAAAALRGRSAVLDGEVVVFGEDGRPDFTAVRARLAGGGDAPATFVVFDLLHLDGRPVRRLPLVERQALLGELLPGDAGEGWCVARALEGMVQDVLRVVAEHELEGVVAKRLDAPWVPGRRSSAWVKHKLRRRLVLSVTGWRPATEREPDTYFLADPAGRPRGAVAMGLAREEREALRESVRRLEGRPRRSDWRPVRPGVHVTVDAHGYRDGPLRDAILRAWAVGE